MDPAQIKALYPKYAGWNDLASIQGDYNAGNAGQTYAQQQSDPVEQARKLQGFYKEQNQPIVQSMQASIPTTQQAYAQRGQALESQKSNLQQRYDAVLASMSATEAEQTKTAQISSAREFGKRGISLSSGAYDQYLGEQVNPIGRYFAAQRGELGAEYGGLFNQLADLIGQNPIQQQQAIDQINQSIAQLQAGNPGQAVQSALQQIQLQQQAQQNAAELALRQRELDLASRPQTQQQNQFATLSPGQTLYDLLAGQALFTAPYKSTSGGGVGALPNLSDIFG